MCAKHGEMRCGSTTGQSTETETQSLCAADDKKQREAHADTERAPANDVFKGPIPLRAPCAEGL